MSEPRSAAIYARISSDDGTALGVKRQVRDCRRLAADLGWKVAEEYVDNDISAYGGKQRPAYERMLADLADGSRDGVIVYHPDRLTRRPIELEQFVEVLTSADGHPVRSVAGGPVDVGDGDGLLVLRMLAAVAANESSSKSRRVRRKLDEVAAAGRPHGGSHRPFGYDDRITINDDEAEVVRMLAARFIAGESVRSLATWLDEEGVKTVAGGPWRTTTLNAMLASPRIAGLRQHRGEVIGDAVWEPIITLAERDKILARMEARKTSGRRAPRRYLLSGLLRCGRCETTLYSSARATTRRYVCLSGPDHGGCGPSTSRARLPSRTASSHGDPALSPRKRGRSRRAVRRRTVAAAEASVIHDPQRQGGWDVSTRTSRFRGARSACRGLAAPHGIQRSGGGHCRVRTTR